MSSAIHPVKRKVGVFTVGLQQLSESWTEAKIEREKRRGAGGKRGKVAMGVTSSVH